MKLILWLKPIYWSDIVYIFKLGIWYWSIENMMLPCERYTYLYMSITIQNLIKRFYHILIWSFGHICIIDWPFEGNCFKFLLSKGNIFAHAGKYQLFGEHYRLFSHSFTWISKIVLEIKMCFSSNTVKCHFDLCNLRQLHSKTSRFIKKKRTSLNLYMSSSVQNTLSQNDPRNTSMDHAVRV